MPHHRLLETVAAELRRQGISAAEVGRLVRELEDHLTGLSMEQGSRMDERMRLDEQIEARLGRSSELVAAALANRRQTSVFGRHPILSFVVAPVPVAILTSVGLLFLCFGMLKLLGGVLGEAYTIEGRAVREWPTLLVYAMEAIAIAVRFLSPALAAALLCWCANRAGMSWRWTMTASGLVALVSGAVVVQVNLPAEPGQGKFLLGLGFPVHQWIHLIQLLVPLGVSAAFLWEKRNRVVVKA